jgi:hypothetical protein
MLRKQHLPLRQKTKNTAVSKSVTAKLSRLLIGFIAPTIVQLGLFFISHPLKN